MKDTDEGRNGVRVDVFGNEGGEQIAPVKTAWGATCRRASVAGVHYHDLRREFANRLLESGATLAEVQPWLGTRTSR
ncbi:MAG TPA: hypothetical protein VGI12_15245 [Vicinamibacterales bacterium]